MTDGPDPKKDKPGTCARIKLFAGTDQENRSDQYREMPRGICVISNSMTNEGTKVCIKTAACLKGIKAKIKSTAKKMTAAQGGKK